jgi:hypothetical protein
MSHFLSVLQQFTKANRKPWYALQLRTPTGIDAEFVGYRHELEAICRNLGVMPEELSPTTEKRFFRRAGDMPKNAPVLPQHARKTIVATTEEQERVFERAVLNGLVKNLQEAYEAGCAGLRLKLQELQEEEKAKQKASELAEVEALARH